MTLKGTDAMLVRIAGAVRDAGGRAILVGGSVRDRLLAAPETGDRDVELFGLDAAAAADVLARFGKVLEVGRAFPVLRLKGLDVDFSLPRASSESGGVRGDLSRADPGLDFAVAARRRDLTINAMGMDLLDGAILDPLGGRDDLAAGRLRAADASRFGEDPLRGLRVARFAARFEMCPDAALLELCRGLDLGGVAVERLFVEWRKLLMQPARPSLALTFLRESGLLDSWPELTALDGVPQDPGWHPEGDVWVHTLMVLDAASSLRADSADDAALMFAALCHDLGKPATTVVDGERIRAPAHEAVGAEIAEDFMQRLGAPLALTAQVACLVRHHLAPAQLPRQRAGRTAYRRLARRLQRADVGMHLLERLARADQFGRTTPQALAGVFPDGDEFLLAAALAGAGETPPEDAVKGRHLQARGYRPGREFAGLISRCREIQDETGIDDPERILDLLAETASTATDPAATRRGDTTGHTPEPSC